MKRMLSAMFLTSVTALNVLARDGVVVWNYDGVVVWNVMASALRGVVVW